AEQLQQTMAFFKLDGGAAQRVVPAASARAPARKPAAAKPTRNLRNAPAAVVAMAAIDEAQFGKF
ncbi:MAG: methyl-accepting chemotaxis protein, partial [Bacteroidia bacterium]